MNADIKFLNLDTLGGSSPTFPVDGSVLFMLLYSSKGFVDQSTGAAHPKVVTNFALVMFRQKQSGEDHYLYVFAGTDTTPSTIFVDDPWTLVSVASNAQPLFDLVS